MTSPADAAALDKRDPFDRLLGLFTDVHPGEGARAAVMLLNIFVILVSYSIMKTVREPLNLATPMPEWGWLTSLGITGKAELVSYAAAAQALLLMAFVPAYSWFASRVDRMKLVCGVTAFFAANIVLFVVGVRAGVGGIGQFFYIWLGLFNMSIVAQFWSYANDIYTKDAGNRLFPIIGVGMTAGAPLGSWIAKEMFEAHLQPHVMLYLAAGLLLSTVGLYGLTGRAQSGSPSSPHAAARIGGKGAFSLVFASRYVGLIALLLVLLNFVNAMGEFLLRKKVEAYAVEAARLDPTFDVMAFVGGYAGGYQFWVNVAAVLLQILVAPRLVKRFGLTAVLFALPFIALGAYGFLAFGATLAIVRIAKTAENSTDYSIMNTARQLLWLPTSREQKYKAKQAVDTFFVRLGDLASAAAIFLGTTWLASRSGGRQLGVEGFAAINVVVVIAWLFVAVLVLRENHRLSAVTPADKAPA